MKRILNKLKKIFSKKNSLSDKEKRHSLVGQPHLWKMKQQFQIEFLMKMGLKKEDSFLDIGCGTLRGGIPIIRYLNKEKYYGIDVRSQVIEEAKNELIQEKLSSKKPTLVSFSNFSELHFNFKFDKVFAFSVLIHLSDDILENCLRFVSQNLSDSGVFYANVNVIENQEGNWQGFPVVFRSLDFYKEIAKKYSLDVEVISSLRDLGHVTKKIGDEQLMLKFTKKSIL
uniref:class I SAM-dependent methyltransferase n=1 Tax=Gelidibacter sp. TaxID=2018083 RepID=UPI00404B10BC